jgi:anti-anti-sigma regulatory factor
VAAITCDVEPIGTRLLVRITGELSVSSATRVRMTLLKCLVDRPDAVVVDLAGLTVTEPAAASVFLAVSRQAALWPGTPLLIASPSPEMGWLLGGEGFGRLATFDSVEAALAVEPRRRQSAISDVMLPTSGAARRARDLVTQACVRWDLAHLAGTAALIASELVTNAAVHAGTMLKLDLSLGHRYLTVSVRDGSAVVPCLPDATALDPAAPRGLLLVDALATRWGSVPAHDGKVVWATLSRRR